MRLRNNHNSVFLRTCSEEQKYNAMRNYGTCLIAVLITIIYVFAAIKPVSAGEDITVKSKGAKPMIVPATAYDAKAGRKGKISLDFVESDIHDVIKALALHGGVNIVASPDVKGNITISLSSVTVDEASNLIAKLCNYRIAQIDGTYVVGTPENIDSLLPPEPEEYITESVAVRYSNMDNMKALIAREFPSVQTVTEASATRSISTATKSTGTETTETTARSSTELSIQMEPVLLVIFGPRNSVLKAKEMVESIERSMGEIANETVTDMMEIRYADILEVIQLLKQTVPGVQAAIGPNQGFNLIHPEPTEPGSTGASALDTDSSSSTGGEDSIYGTAKNRAQPKILILKGTQQIIDRAKEFVAKIDIQVPQIMIEAKVLDINNDASKELGIDWSWTPFNISEVDKYAYELDENGRKVAPEINVPTFGTFHRTPAEITAVVNALVRDGKGRIMANPNVIAVDGKPSSIVIGDKLIYVKSVLQGTTGPTIETDEIQVGVQLHTVSSISSDGYITMSLHPEVSVITQMLPSNGGYLPQIANRYIDSTVRVKDGETIVLGGLIKEEEIENMSGIPILKDLPFFGQFFRTRTKEKKRSEVIMFITPRIISK